MGNNMIVDEDKAYEKRDGGILFEERREDWLCPLFLAMNASSRARYWILWAELPCRDPDLIPRAEKFCLKEPTQQVFPTAA